MGLQQAARVIYRVHTDPADPTVRLISQVKANNEPGGESLRFVIEDSGEGPRVVLLTAAEISRRQASWRTDPDASASTAILSALRGSLAPLSVAQLSDMTGVGVPTVRTLLWRMTKRGQITGDAGTALKFSGLWGLVSGFPGLVTVWLHVGRGGVTGCGGP